MTIDKTIFALIALVSAGINLAYYIKHANGKKHIRLLSAIILANFSIYIYTGHQGTLAHDLPILTLIAIPIFDTITDWRTKLIRTKGRNNDSGLG